MKFLIGNLIILFALNNSFSQNNNELKQSMLRGKIVYDAYCSSCHQSDGGGVPRMNPPLINTKYVLGDSKQLITIILNGLNTPIEINGEEYENPMASHSYLTDVQIADVLTFIRNSFGNKASVIQPKEIKLLRIKPN